MKRNESTADRVVRGAAGAGAVAGGIVVGVPSVGGIALLAVGAILLVTAATGFCPLYRALGLSTFRAGADVGARQ